MDGVFDPIGGAHIWQSRKALRPGGRVVVYGHTPSLRGKGLASDHPGRRHRFRGFATIGLYIAGGWLLPGRKRVVPYSIQTLKRLKPAWFRQDLLALLDLLQEQKIKPIIAQRFPLAEAKHAFGSTIALVDANGNLVTQYAYDPFGNTTVSGAANSNAFQYTGRENEGSGLYYYRARYVDTIYGRFISPDPSGLAAGINQYAYVEDGFPNFVDPFGLDKKDTNNCVPRSSLNWAQSAQLEAAEAYVDLTGFTVGFGAGGDAAGGWGPGKWKLGGAASGSTMIVADSTGQAGFLNSWSLGGAGFKATRTGLGGGASAGLAVLASPFPISKIKGPSGSVSAAGGAVLGGGFDLTTSGALTINLGLGAGAEAGFDLQGGSSTFIPFCKK